MLKDYDNPIAEKKEETRDHENFSFEKDEGCI
jgi:hypothetical protein